MIKELNENNFEENIKSGLKLVEFYATWCGLLPKAAPDFRRTFQEQHLDWRC